MRFFAIIAAAAAIKLTHKTHHRQEDATKPAKDGEGKGDDGPEMPAMSAGECRELSKGIDDMLKDAAGENDVITKAEALAAGASEDDWAAAVATADGDDDGKLQKSEWGALKKSWMDEAGCKPPKPKDGKKGGKDGEGSKPAGGEKPEKSDD